MPSPPKRNFSKALRLWNSFFSTRPTSAKKTKNRKQNEKTICKITAKLPHAPPARRISLYIVSILKTNGAAAYTAAPFVQLWGCAVVLCLIAQAAEQEGNDLGAGAGQLDLFDLTCRQCRCKKQTDQHHKREQNTKQLLGLLFHAFVLLCGFLPYIVHFHNSRCMASGRMIAAFQQPDNVHKGRAPVPFSSFVSFY